MLPHVVVSANDRRPAPGGDGWLPVGIRHGALSQRDEQVTSRQALCGAPLTGWLVFATTEFDGSQPGDCQRCAQVRRGMAIVG